MEVRCYETGQANFHALPAIGEQELHEQEAVRHELGGNGNDVEVCVHPSLVLRCCIA